MRVILFLLKLVLRILLIPIWLILLWAWVIVAMLVNLYSIAQGFATFVIGLTFVGWLIWYRHIPMGFVLLAVTECILFTILYAGVMIQVILEEIRKNVGLFILGV